MLSGNRRKPRFTPQCVRLLSAVLGQIPLVITLIRFVASPVLAWLIVAGRYREALVLTLIAGVTDWLDGYSARKLGVSGKVGVILDPLADKLMLVTLFFALASVQLIPVWMLLLVMGRDVVIVVGAILLRTLRGRRNFIPSMLGKISTFFQIVFVFLVLSQAAYPYELVQVLAALAFKFTVLFTALSWIEYVRLGIRMTSRSYQEAI